MKAAIGLAALSLCGWSGLAAAQSVGPKDVPNAAPNQWFTGPLEAPSPALSKAGMLALEPYFIYHMNTGAYGDNGHHHSVADDTSTIESLMVVKYGITDRLTIQALPSISHTWSGSSQSAGTEAGDLPLELEYRVKDGNYRNGAPSVTFDLGATFPTGAYDRLRNSLNGVGQGAYLLKEGVVLQSLFDTPGNHPVRIRAYAEAFEPLTQPSVAGVSVYGTGQGFEGKVRTGVSGVVGIGGGWALDRHWVFVLDLVYSANRGYHVHGSDPFDNPVRSKGLGSSTTALAPAIEYNLSASAGFIAGVEFTAAGRNSASYAAPQIAFAVSF